MERLGVASPPVYGQGGPPLRSTSSTPIPHWPASRPRLNEPTIGLQRDGGREETTRRRAAQTPGARAASLSIDKRYRFGITDDAHVVTYINGAMPTFLHPATNRGRPSRRGSPASVGPATPSERSSHRPKLGETVGRAMRLALNYYYYY